MLMAPAILVAFIVEVLLSAHRGGGEIGWLVAVEAALVVIAAAAFGVGIGVYRQRLRRIRRQGVSVASQEEHGNERDAKRGRPTCDSR